MPKDTAAENPIMDQINGIAKRYLGNAFSVHNSKPNVKMVVGQGRPKVGDFG
jgi:hypothetical protein